MLKPLFVLRLTSHSFVASSHALYKSPPCKPLSFAFFLASIQTSCYLEYDVAFFFRAITGLATKEKGRRSYLVNASVISLHAINNAQCATVSSFETLSEMG